jgi:TetR/AcrR family transcriptional regulator
MAGRPSLRLAPSSREEPPPEGRGGAPAEREPARNLLLAAARAAFAERGFDGARVDDIARRARLNKQLVYHYFGSKDGLYAAVLRSVYAEIRAREQALCLDNLPAEEAMRRLVEFSFDFLHAHPDFVAIIMAENMLGGRHLPAGGELAEVNRPILDLMRKTLARGTAEGVFRPGLDPLHLYLSVAGMSFFYFSNTHTLSRVFARPFADPRQCNERRAHIVDFTLNAIRAR